MKNLLEDSEELVRRVPDLTGVEMIAESLQVQWHAARAGCEVESSQCVLISERNSGFHADVTNTADDNFGVVCACGNLDQHNRNRIDLRPKRELIAVEREITDQSFGALSYEIHVALFAAIAPERIVVTVDQQCRTWE
jgi:hypothetical protein